jgi:hypothetical protein
VCFKQAHWQSTGKKELICMAKTVVMIKPQPFPFLISDSPEITNSLYNVDTKVKKLLEETYLSVNQKSKDVTDTLVFYIEQYPDIPHFKNRLASYYQLTGNLQKAKEINLLTVEQHPEYLFGKMGLALSYYYEDKFDEIPVLLGDRLELDALYPGRKVFHTSEVLSYYQLVALYLNAVDRTNEAWDVIDRMDAACPGHSIVNEASKAIISYNVKRVEKGMEEMSTTKRVTGSFRQTVQVHDQLPQFENSIIEELYRYDFRLPLTTLTEILSLPEESLVRDLQKVLDDSIARYHIIKADKTILDENTQFLTHAIFILAEKKKADYLQPVLAVLKNGEEFTDFYFGDVQTELLWIALYKMCATDVSPLFAFLKEQNVDTGSKIAANQAAEQLFYHCKNLQQDIIEEYRKLTGYFIANKEDETLTDMDVISDIACTMRDIAVDELKVQIKSLYEHDLVFTGYAGSYESLINDPGMSKKRTIPTIHEMYEEVLTTWAGYNDDYRGKNMTNNIGWKEKPYERAAPKIGRNDPCPCGSGKKYKKCCGK